MTFVEAAVAILKAEGRPLHYKRLTELAIRHQLLSHVGRTPEDAMQAQLSLAVRRKSDPHGLVRDEPGVFGLKQYPPPGERVPLPSARPEAPTPKRKADKADKKPAAAAKRRGRKKDKELASQPEAAPPAPVVEAIAEPPPAPPPEPERAPEPEPEPAPAAAVATADALVDPAEAKRRRRRRRGGRGRRRPEGGPGAPGAAEVEADEADAEEPDARPAATAPPPPAPRERPAEPPRGGAPRADAPRLADAAHEVLRGAGGRGLPAAEIAAQAARRGLLREGGDLGIALRLAMVADNRGRLASGLRPRFRAEGEGRFALSARAVEPELFGQERSLAERLDAFRRETWAAYRRRVQRLSPEQLEGFLRVLLEAAGLRDVARERGGDRAGWSLSASRHRARGGAARALVFVHPTAQDLGRRAVTEAREAARAAGAAEVVVVTIGRASGDAIAEATRGAPPVAVLDLEAITELAAAHGLGLCQALAPVQYLDAEFFEGL